MTSPRRLVASRFPTRLLGPALAALQREWHPARWAEDRTALTGTVRGTRLGPMQDGELTLDVGGRPWTVEVGHPWRSHRARLPAHLLEPGSLLTVVGHRHPDPACHAFKAEQVVVEGRVFDLHAPPC
jgi:hypothetical protein